MTNVLQDQFGLDSELHEEFIELFKANCRYLGIESGLGETKVSSDGGPEKHAGDIRVVGEAKGKFDRTAFVIMPFSERAEKARPTGFFEQVLTSLITPAGNSAGFAVETAEREGSDVIQSTIVNQLLNPDLLVIADLTDHNPNVLFELGIRIAKGLPVALIKAQDTGRIFDVDHLLRVFPYNPNLWVTTVKEDVPKLARHVKATWDNRGTTETYMQILARGTVASGAVATVS